MAEEFVGHESCQSGLPGEKVARQVAGLAPGDELSAQMILAENGVLVVR